MARPPGRHAPTLAQRALELAGLRLPSARLQIGRGRMLRYWFSLAPSAYSRVYRCLLRIPRDGSPQMNVLEPDLQLLAAPTGQPIPHVYPTASAGTSLCLWLPRNHEWQPQMKLADTYLAWTAQWLNYFEEWLYTGEWAGGGVHPESKRKRWPRR